MAALEVEEIRSLVRVGAMRAMETLASLLGQEVRVRGLEIHYLVAGGIAQDEFDEIKNSVGVFFELKGGIGGFVGFFLSCEMRAQLVARLLDREWNDESVSDEAIDSMTCEVGNILVSHIASVMADCLGEPMVPSIPHLEAQNAKQSFVARIVHRLGDRDRLWLESAILDGDGDLLGHIVWVPDGALTQASSR